jgi:hypothetical protein
MSASADEPQLTCPKCGTPLQRDRHSAGQCFVCLLELALDEEEIPTASAEHFNHYQVATHPDGTPVELGRGAMGVTYKAFDVDLRYPVTLKVIGEKYLDDESARLRFLREAPAAAPASVMRMLPRSSIWAEAARVTSMRWSLWKGRHWKA